MKSKLVKKLVSILLSITLALGVFTINAGAVEFFYAPDPDKAETEFSFEEYQLEAIDYVLNSERLSGLVGFGDVNLNTDEWISVIVEFNNKPGKVAEAMDTAQGVSSFSATSFYNTLADADRVAFFSELNAQFTGNGDSALGIAAYSAPSYAVSYNYYASINGVAISLPANMVSDLLDISSVYAVYPDIVVELDPSETVKGEFAAFAGEAQAENGENAMYDGVSAYGMDDIRSFFNLNSVYENGITGENVIVGILDTGVDYFHPDLWDAFLDEPPAGSGGQAITVNHPDLGRQTKFFGWDFIGTDPVFSAKYGQVAARDPYDPYETSYSEWQKTGYSQYGDTGSTFYTSHGTHVAGIIAGRGQAANLKSGCLPQLGVAPGANIIAYRVLGPYGTGLGSSVLKGIDQAAIDGCDVVNVSLGAAFNDPYYVTSIAVNNVIMAYGTVFCVAAGNGGGKLQTLTSPATGTLAITVGNMALQTVNPTDNRLTVSVGDYPVTVSWVHRFANSSFTETGGGKYIHTSPRLNKPDIDGNYDFVIIPSAGGDPNTPGLGTAADYQSLKNKGIDLKGKIAVVRYNAVGDSSYLYQGLFAYQAGLGAVMLLDMDGTTGSGKGMFYTNFADVLSLFLVPKDKAANFLYALTANNHKGCFTDLGSLIQGPALAGSSSRGPVGGTFNIKPEIVAPGTGVYSTVPFYDNDERTPSGDYSEAYALYTGTSMSSPLVAGFAALLISKNKNAAPEEIKSRLANTANRAVLGAGSGYSVHEVGSGVPDIARALNAGAYVTVRTDNVGARDGGFGSTSWTNVSGDIAAFAFGSAGIGKAFTKTMTATVHNTSDSNKTYNVSYAWNNQGQGVIAAPWDKAALSAQTNQVNVPAYSAAAFDMTINVSGLTGETDMGSLEGYVFLEDTATGEILSLPFALQLVQADAVTSGGILRDVFLNKPVISTNPGTIQGERSGASMLWFALNETIVNQIYLKLYITRAENFNANNPTAGFIGVVPQTAILKAGQTANAVGGYYTSTEDFLKGYYSAYGTVGDRNSGSGAYTYLEPGYYIVTAALAYDEGGVNLISGEPMLHMDLYVDNEPPTVAVGSVNLAAKTITGTVYDAGVNDMVYKNIRFDYGEINAARDLMRVIAMVDNAYYAEAVINGDGYFTVDLGALRPLAAAKDSAPITTLPISESTQIYLFAYDGFERQTKYTTADSSAGFMYNGGSFRTMRDAITVKNAYIGSNVTVLDFKMGDYPAASIWEYNGLTLEVGESKRLTATLNSLAAAMNLTVAWESNDYNVLSVGGDGVVTAMSPGVATLTASVQGGTPSAITVYVAQSAQVPENLSVGVNIPDGAYVYYGALNHPTQMSHVSFGRVLGRESAKAPVLWRVMGREDVYGGNENLTVLSVNVLDTQAFNQRIYNGGYADSTFREYLNGDFLKTFSAAEESAIPAFDVDAGFGSNAQFVINGQRVYLPWAKNTGNQLYWSAASGEDGYYAIPDDMRRATLKSGYEYGAFYATRTKADTAGVPKILVANPDGSIEADNTNVFNGVRPLTKIDLRNVVFAADIGTGGTPVYKLTVLGKGGGSAVGGHNVGDIIVTGENITLANVTTEVNGSDYSFNYKLTADGVIVRSGAYSADAIPDIVIDMAGMGLDTGKQYTLYTWLQKNNGLYSNEAGIVKAHDIILSDPGTDPGTGTEPFITGVYPGAAATDVETTGDIFITFNTAMTIPGNVCLKAANGEYGEALPNGAFTESSGYMSYVVPYDGLDNETTYFIKIEGFGSPEGICPVSDGAYFFTTKAGTVIPPPDLTKPAVLSVTPVGTVPVNTDKLFITFDREMDMELIGTVVLDNGGAVSGGQWINTRTAEFGLSGLVYNTTYTISITGFTDSAGNVMEPDYSHGFTTENEPAEPVLPPYVVSVAPFDGALDVAVNGQIKVTFDQPMTAAGTLTLSGITQNGAWNENMTVYTATYSGLEFGTQYTITVNADFVSALGANLPAAVSAAFMTIQRSESPSVSPSSIQMTEGNSVAVTVNFGFGAAAAARADINLANGAGVVSLVNVAENGSSFTVKGDAPGTATIEVRFDTGAIVPVNVTISPKPPVTYFYGISIAIEGGGTAKASKNVNLTAGETVTLTATPSAGYKFKEWRPVAPESLSGIDLYNANTSFTMPDSSVSLTAVFEATTYTVMLSGVNGTATANGYTMANVAYGGFVSLKAYPNAGYRFVRWEVTSKNVTINNDIFAMPAGNVNITAIFEAAPYTVTVTKDGQGTATASTVNAAPGSTVTLTATPAAGYKFVSWQVVGGGAALSTYTDTTTTFIMPTTNVTVKAIFEAIAATTYTVQFSQAAGGTATASKTTAAAGETISLTATPESGYKFVSWQVVSGGAALSSYTNAQTTFTMPASSVVIKANFEAVAATTYTVQFSQATGGTATASKTAAAGGETISLTATPASGYKFVSWQVISGGAALSTYTGSTATFTMPTANVTIKANFEAIAATTYAVQFSQTTGGTATASKTAAAGGETVTLTAAPTSGYKFVSWQVVSGGAALSTYTGTTATFVMPTSAVTIKANFEAAAATTYLIQFSQNAGGTAAASKTSASPGETISLSATPASGYTFSSWNVLSGNMTPVNINSSLTSFVMPASAVLITPIFTQNSSNFSVTVNVRGNGSAFANPNAAAAGTTVNLSAFPDAGWSFSAWEVVSGLSAVPTTSFVMPQSNVVLTAVFVNSANGMSTVRFLSDGVAVTTRQVTTGTAVGATTWPAAPVKNGYQFNGWVSATNVAYNSATPIWSNIDLTASWSVIGASTGTTSTTATTTTPTVQVAGTTPASQTYAFNSNGAPLSAWTSADGQAPLTWKIDSGTSHMFTKSEITNIMNSGCNAIVTKEPWSCVFVPSFWSSLGLDKVSYVDIQIVPVNGSVNGASLSAGDINKRFEGYSCDIKVIADGMEITSFPVPIIISVNLSGVEISAAEGERMSIVKLGDNGKVRNMGDKYNAATKSLTTEVSSLSKYGVMYVPALQILNLTLDSKTYVINGVTKESDVAPAIIEGRTMVPLRFFAEAFGATVDWSELNKTATITLNDHLLVVTPGQRLPGMDVLPQMIDDRIMIPLRFIAESLEINVIYDVNTRTVRGYK